MKTRAFAIAAGLALVACVCLGIHIYSSRWVMAADEAVHAIDGLRLYDDLHQGHLADFVKHTYFSERWQPPVNNHLRWYPFVHSWMQAASFLVLGPSDFSARLPSVICLFGSCLLFYAIAWRLAPLHRSLSGLVAVLLLLAAPNIVSFFADGLIESSIFFMTYLALLAYIRFLEAPDSRGRAMAAGAALAAAVLTKYDHGILLGLTVGLSEAVRARFHPVRALRSAALHLFATTGAILGLWFAHPDKIRALLDAGSHPFFGRPISMSVNYLATCFLEYTTDPAIAVLIIFSAFTVYSYRHKSGIRAIWIFALIGFLFLMSRGRFRCRYNIVEAPAFLLLSAILLPEWISGLAKKMALWSRAAAVGTVGAGVAGAGLAAYWLAHPGSLFGEFATLFRWLYAHGPKHLGLKLDAEHFVRYFATLRGGFEDVQYAVLVVSAGILVVGVALLIRRDWLPRALIAGLLITFVPGAARLWIRAPRMVDWEINGSPALHEAIDLVEAHVPPRVEILLGGGWNNLANNTLRWYLLTGYGPRAFEDIHVWGATIGSVVLPPEPRVAYWSMQLATAPAARLPDAVVLITPLENFLQHLDFDQDAVVYRRVLSTRTQYRLEADRELPRAGCRVEVYRRRPGVEEPAVAVDAELPPPIEVGKNGWMVGEDAWRGYWNPLIYPQVYESAERHE